MKQPEYTANKISVLTGVDRETVVKWLKQEEIAPIRTEARKGAAPVLFYGSEAFKAVKDRDAKRLVTNGESDVDPETGLTWFKAHLREQTITRRRENEIAEKLKNEEWMSTETHHKILAAVLSRIEQVPGKAKSELGLTDAQTIGIRRMLDEAREAAAKQAEEIDSA